jgi:acetyltransferase-like isoleucine patch superfamily enzyme
MFKKMNINTKNRYSRLIYLWRMLLWGLRVILIILSNQIYSGIARLRLVLLGANIGRDFDCYGWINIICHPRGYLLIGDSIRLNSGFTRNAVGGYRCLGIHVGPNAKLVIGDKVSISNSTIVCMEAITIGDEVFIGGGCNIYDTDFHPIEANERILSSDNIKTAPVVIKRCSFIGGHTIILKGVTIGEGAIVGSGSVVTRDVPNYEIWAGNPVRRLGQISTKT